MAVIETPGISAFVVSSTVPEIAEFTCAVAAVESARLMKNAAKNIPDSRLKLFIIVNFPLNYVVLRDAAKIAIVSNGLQYIPLSRCGYYWKCERMGSENLTIHVSSR